MKSLTMAAKVLRSSVQENILRIQKAFLDGVNAVQPHELIGKYLKQDTDKLFINGTQFDLQQNVYVVGFGKAVIGMLQPIQLALMTSKGESHLNRGILSVPFGIQRTLVNKLPLLPSETSYIEILEGAKENIPDEASFAASKKIVSLVKELGKQDLLLVLISGGGSALLPYPVPPLTLDEKSEMIRSLSHAGASITELNTVRKVLSVTKGGGLAKLTNARIVSLILSDIINSPIDMIASGPTVPNRDAPGAAEEILKKYNISTPECISTIIQKKTINSSLSQFPHVTNLIIGSNETALVGVEASVRDDSNSLSLVLTSALTGEASTVGRNIAELIVAMTHIMCGHQSELSEHLLLDLCVSVDKRKSITEILIKSSEFKYPIWLIFGGETTVTVRGSGRGGRNQEMVLSTSVALEEKLHGSEFIGEIIFLSGGTDGIDGPTDAAGALTYWCSSEIGIRSQAQEAREQGLIPEDFLGINDSYTYFTQLSAGQYLLKPGHTGTNVMDLQIIFINPK
nr:glycerate kinase-like [Procambarus clarkii]XP_045600738.1 glycerate kinase-like [Procambarus clarkii]XP_045600739.1 glycerate kinase-like [Procambarus clarkii]XP_045600740.1 glycerate kinase-like [Procambarus clarkii]XP_045600741.1 glycerate kinase-like [Procambarus clarkii]XP_045600742.1 glycerate kinase-like [Procambarus clarkii]